MAKKVICDTDVMIDYWDLSIPRHSQTKYILEDIITLDNVVCPFCHYSNGIAAWSHQ